jgi:uncharacterized membrane protein
MKKLLAYTLALSAMVYALSGCLSDKVVEPAVPEVCDSSLVTYTAKVAPLLQARCNSCHSEAVFRSLGGRIALYDYETAQSSFQGPRFFCAIRQQGGDCQAMPRGSAKLSDCEINMLQAWVDSGFVE